MKNSLFFLLFFIFSINNYSQNSGDIEQLYGFKYGFSPYVILTTALQSDGKILVGGKFTTYTNSPQNYIIRLNVDGTKDDSFNIGSGFNDYVNSIIIQPDGKIVVGGKFTSYNGTAQNYVTRLNLNGSIDATFTTGTGFSNEVLILTRQLDGKILTGGSFTSYNGVIQNYITRLTTNGSLDTGFLVSNKFNGLIKTISIQNDGKICAGGSFTSYFGTTANRLIRLNTDGTRDMSFNIGNGSNNDVLTLAVQSNGKLVIGGSFTLFNGIAKNHINRINSDGSNDSTFNIGIGFDSDVNSLAIQNDSNIIVGGSFNTYNNTSQNQICRLLSDANLDINFNIGTGFTNSGISGIVNSLNLQPNSKIIVGGTFTNYNQTSTYYGITCLNTNGIQDLIFNGNLGFEGSINAIKLQTDGKSIVAGNFNSYKGQRQMRICRLNTDSTIDFTFNSGTGFNQPVNAVEIQLDGKILVGGSFTSYNGTQINRFIRLNSNGSIDASFNVGSGFNDRVTSIAVQTDGKILIGGNFTSYNGTTKNYLIRLFANGSIDLTFNTGTGFNAYVNSIAILSNGKIIAGGEFTSYNSIPYNYIISLNPNGTVDNSFNTGTGFFGRVITIELQNDSKILVGGRFTFYNNLNQNYLVRLNTNGTKDTSFNIGNGPNSFVSSFALQTDGKIIIGGYFTTYNNNIIAQNRIARLNTDGSLDTSFNSGTGLDNYVYAVTLQTDNKLLVGGVFNAYKNSNSSSLVRVFTNSSLNTNNFELEKVLIYPNPVKDILLIKTFDNSIYNYEIFDLDGKKILVGTSLLNEINMVDLKTGLYILTLKNSENNFNYKILKE